MREAFLEAIAYAANSAGLSDERIIDIVKKDNLTIDRPRAEIQFLPEKLTRTGRKLAVYINDEKQIRKRELYTVEQDVAVNVLAEDENWLEDFCYVFLAELPRGVNDKRGNWVRITGKKATFGKPKDARVGDTVIEVFKKVNELVIVTFLWRITSDEADELIRSHDIDIHATKQTSLSARMILTFITGKRRVWNQTKRIMKKAKYLGNWSRTKA